MLIRQLQNHLIRIFTVLTKNRFISNFQTTRKNERKLIDKQHEHRKEQNQIVEMFSSYFDFTVFYSHFCFV